MNRLEALYDLTKQLKAELDQEITPKNREAVIEQVNRLIEERGNLMEQVEAPFTLDEKQYGEKLVQMNESIQRQLEALFESLKTEMKQMKQQKKSNRSYTNPYDKVQVMDGMYMDRKN